eukprot:CAMPEP_0201946038 /NCGR_PEP_ID=MMETSP0903-20130614/54213_1 /ASSEMBLY_ACC=CAM_ASM_000552 /TAXON_ID=420261 /ORGANISM="Thalassiosira antarctica, Strain CCMP982" /LENGTH=85 /DNA_ID=CAMNT_0048489127 /DNA_START=1010 /DNA_END=1267 /DNA_ORIENTATION=+
MACMAGTGTGRSRSENDVTCSLDEISLDPNFFLDEKYDPLFQGMDIDSVITDAVERPSMMAAEFNRHGSWRRRGCGIEEGGDEMC